MDIRLHESVRTVACIGTGVIGAGWVAQYLRAGYQVVAWDSAPDWSNVLRERVESALAAEQSGGEIADDILNGLTFAADCAAAAAAADFVQESGPESLDLKQKILGEISEAAASDVVIASSTSGILPTDLQQGCTSPERVIVAHPFNPVHLIPLVELVGGAQTSTQVIDWAEAFYRSLGKKVIVCDGETPGFIANRLQEAMFREGLHMVKQGEATVSQIDDAIRFGPGLRWALMGPFLTYKLAGGKAGIQGLFDKFGDTIEEPWSRLEAPALTDEFVNEIVTACNRAYGVEQTAQLEQRRDKELRAVLAALEMQSFIRDRC